MSDAAREAVARKLHRILLGLPPPRNIAESERLMEAAGALVQAYEQSLTPDDLRRLAAKHGIALVSEGVPGDFSTEGTTG